MDKTIIVLPSSRAIRQQQLSISQKTLFLPDFITISEFISKLCIVDGYKILDADTRVLLLLEASKFKEFSTLQIERNFFTFIKNSSYIFKFFEELSAECFDISKLEVSDIYAEYEEHIAILSILYKRYETLCNEKKLLDKIFIPKLYKFNENYLKKDSAITIKVDGHLTNFELELLDRCCGYCEINLIFTTSNFNQKMQDKLKRFSLEFENNYIYKISLNKKEITSKTKVIQNKHISCESFSESLLQVSFVKKKIYEFIKKGYETEKIAVVLPDEKMATMLKSFDEKSNFNFAMGVSFTQSELYQKLDATSQEIMQDTKENQARLVRVGDEIYTKLIEIYHKKAQEVDFIEFLEEYKNLFKNKVELKIFSEEIFSFKHILPFMQDMSIKSVLNIFLQRLAKRVIDDIAGGKITVMGVLETRSVEFDAVIIVDFTDANVPKKSDKDMFLNTKIREMANLPTIKDREDLQKHYYNLLINNSKEVAISYVSSSESTPSRFLKYLNIKEKNLYKELDYANILFSKSNPKKVVEKEIVLPYSFKDIKLSSTRLKTFLSCKRKYYYKYIKHIDSHDIPTDMPKEWEIGVKVHLALKNLYSKKNSYSSVDNLKKDLFRELDAQNDNNELNRYLLDMQKRKLVDFCTNEIKRFDDGWYVAYTEENLSVDFAGMKLVGNVDRIDKRQNEIEVLDYKTGSYATYTPKTVSDAIDFQLEFYHLLASPLGNVVGCGFYDLNSSKIVDEVLLDEKLAILKSNIKDLLLVEEVEFSRCEDTKHCLFCEYKIMCGR